MSNLPYIYKDNAKDNKRSDKVTPQTNRTIKARQRAGKKKSKEPAQSLKLSILQLSRRQPRMASPLRYPAM